MGGIFGQMTDHKIPNPLVIGVLQPVRSKHGLQVSSFGLMLEITMARADASAGGAPNAGMLLCHRGSVRRVGSVYQSKSRSVTAIFQVMANFATILEGDLVIIRMSVSHDIR